jgi:hypothetical protein
MDMKNIICLILSISICSFANAQVKINLANIKSGRKLEFNLGSMISECKDPHKLKLKFIDGNKVVINSWYKGCPNNRISEEELTYDYYIDDAINYRHEYNWLRTDKKVIVLTNNSAGYNNGYYKLEKKYIISNAYNNGYFIEARIFAQLDINQYPSRNGVYTNAGGCVKAY